MPPNPWPHHLATIAKLRDHYEKEPWVKALFIGGSVAKGWAREDSDVDFMLVVDEEVRIERSQRGGQVVLSSEFCDYEGGYVDGKLVDLPFLRDVANHGSEPARSAFAGGWLEFCLDDEVAHLVTEIPIFQLQGAEDRLIAFYSQVQLLKWFVGEAEKRGDRYLMTHSVSELALYAMRTILTIDRILYPYHKWLVRTTAEAPSTPPGFMGAIDALLSSPSPEAAQVVVEAVNGLRDWNVPWSLVVQKFLEEREWNWRLGPPPLEDR